MQYVIGSIVALATLALAIGAITGRVKNSVNPCQLAFAIPKRPPS